MNSNSTESKSKLKSRLTIVGVFAVFLGPIILAVLMQSNFWSYQPESSKAHGTLLKPVVAIPALQQELTDRDKWWLVVVDGGDCSSACENTLIEIRQLRKTTGRHMGKLALLYVSQSKPNTETSDRIEAIAPGIKIIANAEIYAAIATTGSPTDTAKQIWLMDRELMLFMYYGTEHTGTGIRKDLKKLLTWAQDKPE